MHKDESTVVVGGADPVGRGLATALGPEELGETELPFESSFGHLIRSIHRLQAQLLQARLAQDKVSLGCWYFLRVLWKEDMITQRELSLRTGMNQATTRTAVDRMEAEKLANRKHDPKDRRKWYIRLTPRARALEPILISFADDLNKRILQVLPATEQNDLLTNLLKIYENIKELSADLKRGPGIDKVD